MNACEDTHGHVLGHPTGATILGHTGMVIIDDPWPCQDTSELREWLEKYGMLHPSPVVCVTSVDTTSVCDAIARLEYLPKHADTIVWPSHGHSHEPRAYGDLLIGQCPVCHTGLSTTGWCCKCNMFPQREVKP